MADVLNRTRGAAGRQDRVATEALERALRRRAPRDRDGVAPLSAAFGDQQVPVVAAAVEVRALGRVRPVPDHSARGADETAPVWSTRTCRMPCPITAYVT